MEVRSALIQLAATEARFTEAIEEFEKTYGTDIPTTAMGELGVTVVDAFEQVDPGVRARLFQLVEELLVCGDEVTETAVATGFLEAVVARAEGTERYEAVAQYFGPHANEFVQAWNTSLGIANDNN